MGLACSDAIASRPPRLPRTAGRGALTLGVLRPLPTEPLQIPALSLGELSATADGSVLGS